MNTTDKNRLRRTMLFLSAQKPAYLKDPFIYHPDSLIFDLEDAVAAGEKDAARFLLYHALREIDYQGCERIVRINGLSTPFWEEDIRCAVSGGCDGIRVPKTECAEDIRRAESVIAAAEKEEGIDPGRTMMMAAIESARGVVNLHEICTASERLFGIALSAGDYTKDLHTRISGTGVELNGARQIMIIEARAAEVQCFDTVFTDLDDEEGLKKETELIRNMGFDGKSVINPRQIPVVNSVFMPEKEEVLFAEKIVSGIEKNIENGNGVFTVDGKMIDIAFYETAKRTIRLAKAAGMKVEDITNDECSRERHS